MARTLSTLSQNTGQIRVWISTRLWAQVLTAMALGVITGVFLSIDGLVSADVAEVIGPWLALPGKLFLNLISLVLVPVVVISILQGINAAPHNDTLKRTGIAFTAIVVFTTSAAAVLGVFMALLIQPGSFISGYEAPQAVVTAVQSTTGRLLPDVIAGLVPTEVQKAIAERDMTAIVMLAVMVGIAARQARRDRVEPLLNGLAGALEVAMTIVRWAMYLTPFAVFGLIAQMVMRTGLETIGGMVVYVLTVAAGLALVLMLYLVLVSVFGRMNPVHFLSQIGSVQLLAFSTSSSAAVMPLSIETASTKLGVSRANADMLIPLGATMNMAGTALYQAVAILFLAQMTGVDLTSAQIFGVVSTLVVSAIGAPGTPGVSVAILTSVAAGLGIPMEGMVLIMGVDRILDMARTVVNVTGDLAACVILQPKKVETQMAPAAAAGE